MKIHRTETPLEGLVVLEIDHFEDARGFFVEAWHRRDFAKAGLDFEFVQDNHSQSSQNVLRGLHYQDMRAPIGKLVRCTLGRIFDVAVDLRVKSPTFGRWFGVELSARNKKQIWIPVGFAHGFVALSDAAEVQYKQTNYYTPSAEASIRWDDPEIGIDWPIADPVLSKRDQNGMSLTEYKKNPAFS